MVTLMKMEGENKIKISILSTSAYNFIREKPYKKNYKFKKKKCCLFKSETSTLILILCVYVIIFSTASIVLVISVSKLQNTSIIFKDNLTNNSTEYDYKIQSNFVFKQADSLFFKKLFKDYKWPFTISLFNCSDLSYITKINYLHSGWTKSVYSFELRNKKYALKTINKNGIDIKNCSKKHLMNNCYEKIISKMFKEYILGKELFHKNIVQVLAWCVSSSNFYSDVAIITELCTPVDIISILRMSFAQRLKIMIDLCHLMMFLANSPLGPIAINDFQRQQFVMCGNTLKLTDLDDLSIGDPQCIKSSQCSLQKITENFNINDSFNDNIKCINHFCKGYTEKQNIFNTYKHFVNLFLNISIPITLKTDIETLFKIYTSTWDIKIILKEMELLYFKFMDLNN